MSDAGARLHMLSINIIMHILNVERAFLSALLRCKLFGYLSFFLLRTFSVISRVYLMTKYLIPRIQILVEMKIVRKKRSQMNMRHFIWLERFSRAQQCALLWLIAWICTDNAMSVIFKTSRDKTKKKNRVAQGMPKRFDENGKSPEKFTDESTLKNALHHQSK